MGHNKEEYQLLNPPEYKIAQKSGTKLVLLIVFAVQLVLVGLWAFTLIEKSKTNKIFSNFEENHFRKLSGNTIPDPIFVDVDVFKKNLLLLETSSGAPEPVCEKFTDNEKFDCHPDGVPEAESCYKRNCCWNYTGSYMIPSCYYPKNYAGYKLLNMTHFSRGMIAYLSRSFPSPYPNDVELIKFEAIHYSGTLIQVKITDPSTVRYQPPLPEIPILRKSTAKNIKYKVTMDHEGLKIIRHNGHKLLECGRHGGLIFADKFLQVTMNFKGKIYGLGEHQTSLRLDTNWTKYTFFARDGIPTAGENLYGSHPFYLVMEPNGSSHGVFFHNSNAMDVILQPLPAITFRSIGGIFNFYVFLGPTPADVISQFTEVVGRPFLPPYWSLGFHLSRLGYKNTSHIREVWMRTRNAGIPFDTQWHDIDYMDRRNDFTYDKENYSDLPEFVDDVHRVGMKYIPIIDPGISGCEPSGTYPPFDEGVEQGVFVKNYTGSILIGKVWNKKCTVFPDFSASHTQLWWEKQIREFYKKLPFDGIWLDMNEPTNFVTGSIDGCPRLNELEDPPYLPEVRGGKLASWTLCMSAIHAAGYHYDFHNLYGFSETVATHRALQSLGKRPFIISRSTYPGSGKYAGHWSGDVTSTWDAMKATIPKMLSFSLFGIPMMGADICGFNGNTTDLLCQRWSQLGAFYPFARNHNSDDCIDQDPVALGEDVMRSARGALLVRYSLLPYLYTLFYKAHTEGETVARPLFFEFWYDERTHDIDESFLWGCCILIIPALEENVTTVHTYLPAGRWYDWYTGVGWDSSGQDVDVPAPPEVIPGFIRGGAIIPTQVPALNTKESRMHKIDLIAAFNTTLHAFGLLYWDEGDSVYPLEGGMYGKVTFELTEKNLCSTVLHWGNIDSPLLDTIQILGFYKPINAAYFNGQTINFEWNPTSLILTAHVNHPMSTPFVMEWE